MKLPVEPKPQTDPAAAPGVEATPTILDEIETRVEQGLERLRARRERERVRFGGD